MNSIPKYYLDKLCVTNNWLHYMFWFLKKTYWQKNIYEKRWKQSKNTRACNNSISLRTW